jgi:hypothetical protein
MAITHNYVNNIIVPGFVWHCSSMDSILQSSLECLYSNTNCLTDILLHYINYTAIAVPVPPLNVSNLIRTSSNSTVITLADNLFVEEWITSISHENYFHTCAPSVCQYTYIDRANHLYVVTMFLAVYGGLILSLRLLITLIFKLILRRGHQPELTNNQDGESCRLLFVQSKYNLMFRSNIKYHSSSHLLSKFLWNHPNENHEFQFI